MSVPAGSDMAVRPAASKSHKCHSPLTMFTKQVSRSGGGLDPHRGRRGGAGRANSKKDLVMGPIEVFVPYRPLIIDALPSLGGTWSVDHIVGCTDERAVRTIRSHSEPGRHSGHRVRSPRSSVREMARWHNLSTLPLMLRWPQLAFPLGERPWPHQPLERIRVRCQCRCDLSNSLVAFSTVVPGSVSALDTSLNESL
jgi:hypothetical protein